ncbi:MAG TPA: DUF2892 domain-containing protein [Casimicrobiaceae bacterium]|jgi:hypothetical protein|nr:DUF2892 domain-containing protein [Casimicrobiaceae bacterium]
MTSWQIVRLFAGVMILLSLILGIPESPLFLSSWWLVLAAFVGANLFQAGFSGWCPLEIILRKFGVQGGC